MMKYVPTATATATRRTSSPRKSSPSTGYVAALLFRCAQTTLYLLGFTYLVVVLVPLVQHSQVILSSTPTSTASLSSLAAGGDWNLPQSLLFPHQQPSQIGANSYPYFFTSPQFTTNTSSTPSSSSSSSLVQALPSLPNGVDRKLAIVHIGKAGGVSLRRLTIVFCKLFFRNPKFDKNRQERTQTCIHKHFPDAGAALTHKTQYYFHLDEYHEQDLGQEATSFLVTLRHPVDRIISTYRYSHPGNCNDENRPEVWRPRGCEAERHRNKTGLIQNDLFYKCYPSPAMESFAQSLMRPWKKSDLAVAAFVNGSSIQQDNHDKKKELSQDERRHCRYIAREVVQGHGTYGAGPHMLYNYAYYAARSIWKFPTKEVFAIRTEHEWQDMLHLDKLLGGNGNLKENRDVSHGSEGYVPSPLSKEAYGKLCCALEQEIEVYQDILWRVLNLSWDEKQATMKSVLTKCGIATSWTEWRVKCRRKWRMDLQLLHPSLAINETYYPGHKTGYRADVWED